MPETITYSRLRNQLAKALDKVNEDRTPLLIVRQRGKPAVLLSAEEYSALEETAHLLRSDTPSSPPPPLVSRSTPRRRRKTSRGGANMIQRCSLGSKR